MERILTGRDQLRQTIEATMTARDLKDRLGDETESAQSGYKGQE
jgi:hypothetical protein